MSNYVILPKTSNQTLLANYYSISDVFVICSKRENFPTTCVEAQCCGTPVVGFDVGGTKETTVLSQDDFVPYGDLEALKVKIREKCLTNNRGTISEKAIMEYSKSTMAKKYLGEYDRDGIKKRILLIDVNCKSSSTGKIVYDLFQSIKHSGREAQICYGRGEEIKEAGIYKFGLDWETNIHAGLARITGYNGYFSPISTRRLIKQIEEFQPDLIHIHELHAYFVNIEPLIEYIKEKRIRLVWTFHCEYMYTGKCGHAYECTNYQRECGNCPSIKEYPKSILFDRTRNMLRMKKELLRNFDFSIITPSVWLANRVKTSFLKDNPIRVIHNGIDTSIFCPKANKQLKKELHIPDSCKVILALAPNIMSDAKGGQWILRLAEEMKDEDVFFLLVGNDK